MGGTTDAGRPKMRYEFQKPDFTLSDLKRAIPPHCFEKSIPRASYYLVKDLAFASLFYYATTYFHLLPNSLAYIAWPLYWICQGCMFFTFWVIGHECGHNLFSNYPWLDNIVGMILHSFIFTPYFGYKYSHRRHHSNNCSIEKDEAYVPKLRTKRNWSWEKYTFYLPGRILRVAIRQTIGWYLYTFFNMAGRKYDSFASHFDPFSPIFNDRERLQIVISDAGYFTMLYLVYRMIAAKGFLWMMSLYGIPIMGVNFFLVLTTYLHHTHAAMPRYDSTQWDWLRGAMATVDRDYGILNTVFHNLCDTHVVHHLFPTIPHYHAVEATKAIKPILGKYYNFDSTPILKALWRESSECIYIEPDEDEKNRGVYWFSNKLSDD